MTRILLLCLVAMSILSSCDIINPEEPIPTYVRIDSILVQDASGQTLSSKVTGASISYGNSGAIELLGVFRLPMVIPVLADQTGELYILPSVDVDGMLAQLYSYYFYQRIEADIVPSPGDTLDLGTLYASVIDTYSHHLDEDFEGGTAFALEGADSAADFGIQTDVVCSGDYSGLLEISAPQINAYILNSTQMDIPLGRISYVEIDYKSNVDLGVSLIYYDANTMSLKEFSFIGLRKKEDWNKVYLKIDDDIGYTQSPYYFLAIEANRDPDSGEDAQIYLDNVLVKTQL